MSLRARLLEAPFAVLCAAVALSCASRSPLPSPVFPLSRATVDPWPAQPAPLPPRALPSLRVVTRTLRNGLTLWMLPARGDETLSLRFASRDARLPDERAPAGLGRLAAYALLETEPGVTGAALATRRFRHRALVRWGAGTWWGGPRVDVPWDERAYALTLMRSELGAGELDPSAFDRARFALLRARSLEVFSPEVRAAYLLRRQLFTSAHPLGMPSSGWGESLQGFTRAQAQRWLAQNLRPGSGLLFATGVRDTDAFAAEAEAQLGELASEPVPPAARTSYRAPQPDAARVLCVTSPSAEQTELFLGWHFALAPAEEDAMQLVVSLLGASLSGRFDRSLREERELTYGTETELTSGPQGAMLEVRASLATPDDAAALLVGVLAEVARLAERPLDASEFTAMRDALRRRQARVEGDPSARAQRLLLAWARTGALREQPEGRAALDALTPEALRELVARTLGRATVQITATGSCASLQAALAARGSLPVVVDPPPARGQFDPELARPR